MTSLEDLATLCGIELDYVNAHGSTQQASSDTRKALLAAMGVDAETDDNAVASLSALRRQEWERPLPPVLVAYADAGPVITELTLPSATETVTWRLLLEDGDAKFGSAAFATLPLVGQETLNGQATERRTLEVGSVAIGYHRLTVEPGNAEMALIVTPGRCWLPPSLLDGHRIWGVTAQLYLLRSAGNWGIGDYSDLRRLVEIVGDQGGDVIGLNPLHAMFLDDPEHASPYSPASRLLLNDLNIDIASLPEMSESEEARRLIASTEFQQRLEACRSASSVDYAMVADLKLQVLRLLYTSCRADRLSDRWCAFTAFRDDRGEVLERSCLFLGLREHFAARDHADWHTWPEDYRDPASPAVTKFAQDHEAEVTFQAWLQWVADSQLAAAAEAASAMEVGLYRDLAVGADPAGAETWANQRAVVSAAQVGCPPDIYNTAGQDWGLPPFNPVELREEAYQSFVDLVRANMRHAGGLRIDHVMALQHVYWVPRGQVPAQGAYVRYPLEDLVGILALESQRNQCLIVGEDLGTVPEGFRERMAEANILSYRVLTFEKDESGFLSPDKYPALSLAVAGNHDLPTLQGWWGARDLALKERLNLFPSPDAAAKARAERDAERVQLTAALLNEGLVTEGNEMDGERLIQMAHTFLARSTAMIAMAQIDDLAGEVEPVNIPTTSDEHPNWRRRLSLSLDDLAAHPRLRAVAGTFTAERGKPASQTREWRDAIVHAEAELPAYLLRQRWYPAKDAGTPIVALEQLVPFPVPGLFACNAVWSVRTRAGLKRRIFLPLAVVPAEALAAEDVAVIGRLATGESLVDAFHVDAFVQSWVRAMLGYDAAPAEIEAGHTARQTGLDEEAPWSIRQGRVEQSNTSIRIGESAILKVIRTLDAGTHPELEMGRFLTEDAAFEAVPALLAWMNLNGTTLSVLQAFVANEGDGWSWFLERLRGSAADRAAALVWIGKLGARTAEMHRALASPTEDSAFQAEPITAEDIARWRSDITSMLSLALEHLKATHVSLDAISGDLANSVFQRRDELTRHVAALLPGSVLGHKTRLHGDYHLGQVLVQGGDAIIVDFEGEPLRSLVDRRAKHSPLRDVAGMLRSIDYAAAVAARGQTVDSEALRDCAVRAAATYLASYLQAAEGDNDNHSEALRLIQFFTLEKALYEIVYELANRPDWVAIPLRAVIAFLNDNDGGFHPWG